MPAKSKRIPEHWKSQPKRYMTVYPPEWAEQVLVKGAVNYNDALCCWAKMVADATTDNEKAFTPKQWDLLYLVSQEFEFRPSSPQIGPMLELSLTQPAWIGRSGNDQVMRDTLKALDYVHAWAVLWTCKFREKNPDADNWWRLSARMPQLEGATDGKRRTEKGVRT